ncbi:ribose-phosphate diphosphokinase [Bradyrhizobium sp. GCM10027634]|uniref:ribose-phosphate diphosphokinase n=1 Tax=unclassified Bradyrhizobium TaxID=2631580 RepID=UPI00188A4332|nr:MULTISPECIES: ribose-phosphate diphosphokinase [unclassified Bradyrhizobium]MDN5005247.1 ribose-phosphate diphosphokinase [Bradyrhizobium sp. WYCCWR 12677]QOZ46568.1 phosphoribosylpyrophosphate synthetase [Bradyrhizobium sp. CCBAU 53340]
MKTIALQTLPSATGAAKRLAARLELACDEIALHRFPDGELRITVAPAADTTILYAPLDHPNDKLIALLLAAEALRRGGARRLVLVAPYLCYMRQDIAFHPGEAISQRATGRLLATLVDRVVTVDAHLHRTSDIRSVFPDIEAENLSAMPAIADALAAGGIDPATVVIGPDAESEPWVEDLAARLGLQHTVARKTRHGDRSVDIDFADPIRLPGRPALMVDDIVSSGTTLIVAARALRAIGATAVDAVVTHALFPAAMIAAFTEAGIRSIRSTDSVPHPTNAITLEETLAAALWSELSTTHSLETTR